MLQKAKEFLVGFVMLETEHLSLEAISVFGEVSSPLVNAY